MNIAYTWWIRDLHHYNSYIPTYKQKDLRSESGTSRESNILCFWLCSLFCRVCHRDISDRPLEICVVRSPVDECCNRARKMNPYEAKRNCSREKFRVRPHHAETLCDTSQSANGVKQAHRAFKGDLIGTKRPSEEILVVDTIVVSHPTFLFFTLPLEVCFHLVSILVCNCSRTMNATPLNYSGFIYLEFSEIRKLSDYYQGGRGEKTRGLKKIVGETSEFTFIVYKKFLQFNNVYEFKKI